MKTKILAAIVAVMAAGAAQATLYTYTWSSGFTGGGVIPDGSVTGLTDTRNVSGIYHNPPNYTDSIVDVNVRLNISGGYNGDLYGYLVHDTGFAVLLNRSGRTSTDPFGYADAGFNTTLDDQAVTTTDIHLYQTVGGYNIGGGTPWRPDGRNVDPAIVLDTDSRTALLSSFTGDPNGDWTLFLADMSGGDTSTLVSWGLGYHGHSRADHLGADAVRRCVGRGQAGTTPAGP